MDSNLKWETKGELWRRGLHWYYYTEIQQVRITYLKVISHKLRITYLKVTSRPKYDII